MKEEIKKIEHCLRAMKRCLKIPNVENCICFSDAFKVLTLEIDTLNKRFKQISDLKTKEKIIFLRKEIEEVKKDISRNKKECLGCIPCVASVVFKSYPHRLNTLYLDNKI